MIFFDLETDGFDRELGHILSFSAIDADCSDFIAREVKRMDLYINHGIEIPQAITDINHLTTEYLGEHGVAPEQAAKKIVEFLGNERCIVAGYNNNFFDNPFLKNFLNRYGYEFNPSYSVDVLELVKEHIPEKQLKMVPDKRGGLRCSRKLGDVAEALGVSDGLTFHNSMDDVIATMRIYNAIP